jgi:hypothetical protein
MSKKTVAPPAGAAPAPLPLSARPHDVLIAFWFLVFLGTTTFTDIHNFTASVLGVPIDALEHMSLAYPPKALTEVSGGRRSAAAWLSAEVYLRLTVQPAARRELGIARSHLRTLSGERHSNAEASCGWLGVSQRSSLHGHAACPSHQVYFKWARTVDPLLYDNPPFWQAIEWVNMLVLTPFALLAVPALLAGRGWVRMPAVVVSSFTHYSLILCMGATL